MVQNEKRKKRSPENSVSRKVSNNLVAHQKNKVREHKNVGYDFKKFSHFHIQNSSQSAFFQPFVDSFIQVAAAGIEELKRKPQVELFAKCFERSLTLSPYIVPPWLENETTVLPEKS